MANPLFQALGGNQPQGAPQQFTQLVQQFRQFSNSFRGNPRAEVEKLLQSGQMSQQELTELQAMAQQFAQLM